MPSDSALRVVVTVRLDADGRPVGSARAGSSQPVCFVGWLALMAELSRLLNARVGR